MDRLWTEYSQNHFGWSVQFPTFISTGNRPGRLLDDEAYRQFGEQVGWRRGADWIVFIENLTYSLNAPKGHLPNLMYQYELTGSRLEYTTLTGKEFFSGLATLYPSTFVAYWLELRKSLISNR